MPTAWPDQPLTPGEDGETNLFGGLSVEENIRLVVQARHPSRLHPFRDARAVPETNADTAELLR